MITVIANYEEHQQAFHSLLADDCQRRILLFHGLSGTGKTTLLRACQQKVPPSILTIPIQFREAAVSVAEIFDRAGEHIGWQHMVNFTEQIALLSGLPSVQVEKNWLTGSHNQINVALKSENQADQEHRRVTLTKAWFADLQKVKKMILMVMDTYENVSTDVSQWLEGPFLSRLSRLRHMRLLIAGQRVPEANNIEWGHCCQPHELYGVKEAKHWLPVIEAIGRKIEVSDPLNWLAGVCYALEGRPSEIMKVIETLPMKESSK